MIYKSPTPLPRTFTNTSVFLAGGISNCPDWQKEVQDMINSDTFDVINPRREIGFDKTGQIAEEQITWEHRALSIADDYIFWFPKETLCPITLFELGKILERTMNGSDKVILIGWHEEYQRGFDLSVQIRLATTQKRRVLHAAPGWDAFTTAVRKYYS
jgi:Nucleoside 2-deoxyribosyltransferase like